MSSRLTSNQKSKVKNFVNVTGVSLRSARFSFALISLSEPVATQCLSNNRWNLDEAMDDFWSNRHKYPSAQQSKSGNKGKVSKLFDKLCDDENKDIMSEAGMQQFFEDMKVDPNGYMTFAIAHKIGCTEMGVFNRAQYIEGWSKLGADTVSKQQSIIANYATELQTDKKAFKTMYKWIFLYIREDERKRTVPKELAVGVWSIVFEKCDFPLIDDFVKFISENEDITAISKDEWDNLYEFLQTTNADCSNYDADSGAWPVLYDEFVEHQKAK